jgi:hypothetical protein
MQKLKEEDKKEKETKKIILFVWKVCGDPQRTADTGPSARSFWPQSSQLASHTEDLFFVLGKNMNKK